MTDQVPLLSKSEVENCPKVSIIMPTYNRANQIGLSIRSLLEGSWTDFELLVRDDGDGSDGTEQAVIKATAGDKRVKYHRNAERLGMPGNLNSGITDSTGEFIAVCHDHDIYKTSFLSSMIETLEKYPSALFVHCAIDVIDQKGNYVQSHIGNWPELSNGHDWLKFMLRNVHCPVCALTVVRRSAHKKYGLYDPDYGFISDVEMWMRLSLYGDVAYLAEPLIEVREREHKNPILINLKNLSKVKYKINQSYLNYAYKKYEIPFHKLLLWSRFGMAALTARLSLIKSFLLSDFRL